MKKTALLLALILVAGVTWGQAWTVEGDINFDYEFRLITQEQFNRIKTAQETIAAGVVIQYGDISQAINSRIISGEIQEIDGYFYASCRMIPKSSQGNILSNHITSVILYGNTNTGSISLIFVSNPILFSGAISFLHDNDRNSYHQRLNQLFRLVSGL